MIKAFKTVFKRVRGRIIPIRINLKNAPDDLQKIEHIKRARDVLRGRKTSTDFWDRKMEGVFYKLAKKQSKETGAMVAKRLKRYKTK